MVRTEVEKVITNRKNDVNAKKVSWLKSHEILLDKNHTTIIKMKRTIGDEFQIVSIAKTGVQLDPWGIDLVQLWHNGRSVLKEKVKDSRSMLQLIPEENKQFYSFIDNVKTNEFEEDVDGYAEELYFEIDNE